MKRVAKFRKQQMLALTAAIMATAWMPSVMAADQPKLPTGQHDCVGVKNISSDENDMSIELEAKRAAINWESFNIAKDHSVTFSKPNDTGWAVLNRVTTIDKDNISKIEGSLIANGGTVFLINPNGITFGNHAQVQVGSLVASTLDMNREAFLAKDADGKYVNKDFSFTKNNSITDGGKIELRQTAANIEGIKADGVVALLAHKKIENKGTITGKQVNLVVGDEVKLTNLDNASKTVLDYDEKIGVLVTSLSKNGQIIDSGIINADNGYVVMTVKNAQNVLQSTVNTEQIAPANKIYKDGQGNIMLLGDVNFAGDKVKVEEKAQTHASANDAQAGTFNILSTNAIINDTNAIINDKSSDNAKISNSSLSNTLRDTNVNIVASPLQDNYYSDITIGKEITKGKGAETESVKDTSLTLTAGRNISVDAAITSTAGKLNVQMNGDNKKSTKSSRSDGAVIIRSDIATNGGDFTTTGDNGTYIGLKNEELTNLIKNGTQTTRTINTKGGNISFVGNEVLLATGNTVVLDTEDNTDENNIKRGSVFVNGTINSTNAYSLWTHKDAKGKDSNTTWGNANEASKTYWGENSNAKSYLAVITGALEDAVISATIPPDTNNKSEAFVGGHVVAVKADKDGKVILKDGKPEVCYEDGKVVILVQAKAGDSNTAFNGGWYKDADGNPVRYWAWVDGNEDEKGTIFFIQRVGLNVTTKDYEKPNLISDSVINNHGEKPVDGNGNEIYSNFAPGEPNDDKGESGEGSQTALSVNYTSHDSEKAKDIFYAKWDDVCSNHNKYKYSVIETDLTHTALNINAGETTIGGDIGNDTKLSNLNVASSANINLKGSVYVDNDVKTISANNTTISGSTNAGGLVELIAGDDARKDGVIVTKAAAPNHDISTGAITAGKTISMVADNDVTINGKIKSEAQNDPKAVEIIAQGNFYNKTAVPVTTMRFLRASVPEQAIQVGDGSAWKIYSDNPSDDLGNLNSNDFAVWSWGKTGFQYNTSDDSHNRFIFKATPEVLYTANDKTKAADEEMPVLDYAESYMLNGSALNGRFTANFKDGDVDALKSNYKLDQVAAGLKDGVTPDVEGEYKDGIELKNTANAKVGLEDFGYKTAFNPGTLTVTKAMVPEPQPQPQPEPQPQPQPQPQQAPQQTPQSNKTQNDEKPQLDNLTTTNVDGSASYTTANRPAPGTDRVLGLQSAELPFFREELHQVKFYGTYDVSIDPDKVKMEPSAKVLPEPDQPQNQYREYDKELTTQAGTAKFKLTYNGSTFDIYPTDNASKSILLAGEVTKNVEVESQALFAAFKEMGITLDDLNGVYIHFDNKSEVTSLLK